MSTRTVILGLLRRGPLHGYELKRIIEREMGDWADIAFGSIYFALEKLSQEGFVTGQVKDGEGHRPSRIEYTITEAGREEYLRLLRGLWSDEERRNDPLDVAVAFIHDLPPEEVSGYLEGRMAGLEAAIAGLEVHEAETMRNEHVPPESRFIFSHARHQMKAELEWTRDVLSGLPSLGQNS
jgi:DNA-binding PadR family transcriptional regulator